MARSVLTRLCVKALVSLVFLLSAGCYSYTPAATPSAASVTPPLNDPEVMAVVDKRVGKTRGFTFVGGEGLELTKEQVRARYTRVVGKDEMEAMFRQNKLVALALGMSLAVATTALVVVGVTQCARASPTSSCTSSSKTGLVRGALADAALLAGVFLAASRSPDQLALLTRGQADDLVKHYGEALARSRGSSTMKDPGPAPDRRGRGVL
jgi:hypothetical protein